MNGNLYRLRRRRRLRDAARWSDDPAALTLSRSHRIAQHAEAREDRKFKPPCHWTVDG